jgi:hypothetical protein
MISSTPEEKNVTKEQENTISKEITLRFCATFCIYGKSSWTGPVRAERSLVSGIVLHIRRFTRGYDPCDA